MITVDDATELATSALTATGVPDTPARRTAELLVLADVWGIASHGLMRLPYYLSRLSAGGLRATADLIVVRDTGPVVAFDGNDGLGHWQLAEAAEVATRRADQYGLAAVSVGRSSHCGALGLYATPGIRHDLLTLVFSTGPAVMAAPGTATPLLSTSPIAAGIPGGPRPVVVDLATSAVARGKIAARARTGEALPPGWAVDANGAPTTDAHEALAGMLAPLGGAKGFALAFLVEALTGAAIGPSLATDVPDMFDHDHDPDPQQIGHLVVTINPRLLDVDGQAPQRMARLAANVEAAGGRVPGSNRTMPWDLDGGQSVPVADELVAELRSWSCGTLPNRHQRSNLHPTAVREERST